MEYNKQYEEVLANPQALPARIAAMDPQTLGNFYSYVIGRIEYSDAEESMTYWYAAMVLDDMVEFVAPQQEQRNVKI